MLTAGAVKLLADFFKALAVAWFSTGLIAPVVAAVAGATSVNPWSGILWFLVAILYLLSAVALIREVD